MDAMSVDQTTTPAKLTVILSIGAASPSDPHLRNLGSALIVLNNQTLDRQQYRIVMVEQGPDRKVSAQLEAAVDTYIFALNPGPFNRSWGRNIGANAATTPLLFFYDVDVIAPHDFLVRGLLAWQCGVLAVRPFSGMLYMDEESSDRVRERVAAESRVDCHDPSYIGGLHLNNKGGCTWVDRGLYFRIGGHDERFVGWGDEDYEFWDRLNVVAPVVTLDCRVLHLFHPREFHNGPLPKANRLLYMAIQAGVIKAQKDPIGDINRYRTVPLQEGAAAAR
jgi:hypothetical protein